MPSLAADAPRDLLGQITEALREYELENYAPVEENAADWLALLVQRTRQAERDNEVLEQDYSNCRRTRAEAEAEIGRLREALEHIVANEQCEVAKTGVSPIKTCLDHQIVVPCPYCIAKQALGASRPGEPKGEKS